MFNLRNFKKEITELQTLKNQSVLSHEAKERVKSKLFFSLGQQDVQKISKRKIFYEYTFFRVSFAVFLGFFVVGGTLFASASSLPGSKLYPVKQLKEKIEVKAVFTEKQKAMVQTKHAQERLRELDIIRKEVKVNNGENNKIQKLPINQNSQEKIKIDKSSDSEKYKLIKQKQKNAETEAQIQVKNALESLEKVKEQEKQAGDKKDEKKIDEQIFELKFKSEAIQSAIEEEQKQERIKEKEKKDREDEKKEGEVRGEKVYRDRKSSEEEKKIREIKQESSD